jgi:tetratricopeptide (TPR) repeat protein
MELKLDDTKTENVAVALIEKFNTKAIESYINDSLKAKLKFQQIAKIANELYLTNALLSSSYFYYGSSAIQKANSMKVESIQRKYLATAAEYFTRVIQFNLYDYDASFNLGLTKYRSGNDAVADSIFRSIASKSMISLKTMPDSLSNKLFSMINMENIANGYFEITGPIVSSLDKELAKNTYYTGYWYLYFSSLKNSKTTPTAADKDKISVSGLDPSAIEELYLFLGATETSLKKYDDAIKVFSSVIELNPKNLDAYRNLAVCYREKGDQTKSYEVFQQYEKLKKEQK